MWNGILGGILVVMVNLLVLAVILAVLKHKSDLKNQQKKNQNAWGRLDLSFQVLKINYDKCKEILEGLDQHCANDAWEEANEYFKNCQINVIENLMKSINDDLKIVNYSLQTGLPDRLKILERKIEEATGWLRSVESYPERIVTAKYESHSAISGSKEMMVKLEKMINSRELAVSKKLKKKFFEEKEKLQLLEEKVNYPLVNKNWFILHRDIDRLQEQITDTLVSVRELNGKRDKCLLILEDILDRTSYWINKKTKYNDESIVRLASEAEDLYDQVLRVLENKSNYKLVSTDWDLIYSKLSRADMLDKKARLLYEEYELWK